MSGINKNTKARSGRTRAIKRRSTHTGMQNGSLVLLGCLLIVVGMMLRG